MNELLQKVQELLDELVASGQESGLQVAAYLDGELVLDAVSGTMDALGRPVDANTLFSVFSASKGVTATLIHLLRARGALAYDAAVADYWPEFGTNGKEGITVRQVLAHTAGVPQMPEWVKAEDLGDWELMIRSMADLSPLWTPGQATGYHALTYGWILGEVAQRVTGQSFARLVDELIARPLGIASLYFGLPDALEDRIATLSSGPLKRVSEINPYLMRAIPMAVTPSPRIFNRMDVRRAVIPAAGAITTALALARMYAALVGPVDGVRLLSEAQLERAICVETEARDLVLGVYIPKGLGYFHGGEESPLGPRRREFGHPGAGGSIGLADPSRRFAFALVKNRLSWVEPPEGDAAERVLGVVRSTLRLG